MKTFLRQPLLHFFALGAALFVLFSVVNDEAGNDPGEIVVDAGRIQALVTRFERTWQRPPTPAEMQGLVDSWVREEILYREGLALGFDQDDPVVRRRVAQKVDFMIDSISGPPDDAVLGEWFEARADEYRLPPRYTFEQVFFSPDRHGEGLPALVEEARAALAAGQPQVSGDPTMLPGRLEMASAPEIERSFGGDFAAALETLPTGEWAGPIQSGYGLHLVRIATIEPGYKPALDEVRAAVERDFLQSESERAKQAFYEALRDRYDVRIEADPQIAETRAAD